MAARTTETKTVGTEEADTGMELINLFAPIIMRNLRKAGASVVYRPRRQLAVHPHTTDRIEIDPA